MTGVRPLARRATLQDTTGLSRPNLANLSASSVSCDIFANTNANKRPGSTREGGRNEATGSPPEKTKKEGVGKDTHREKDKEKKEKAEKEEKKVEKEEKKGLVDKSPREESEESLGGRNKGERRLRKSHSEKRTSVTTK
jgi:hypothetical protein